MTQINNKQVNIWRGKDSPPTNYHIWLYDDIEIRLYNGAEWIIFLNNLDIINQLLALQNYIDSVKVLTEKNKQEIIKTNNLTVNKKLISSNPVLSGKDINSTLSGHIIKQNDSIDNNLLSLDESISTLIVL